MPVLRVMLNKLSSDWQVARAVLEDEYKAIATTLNKNVTRFEFVAHLLDVHRTSCGVCPSASGLGVRSSRDTAVGLAGSADRLGHVHGQRMRKIYVSASTQTTDRLHSYAPDGGLDLHVPDNNDDSNINISEMAFPLALNFNGEDEELQPYVNTREEKPSNEKGIKQERHDDESIREKNIEQREEAAVEGWLDNGKSSSPQDLADKQSSSERTLQLSYLLIKEEEAFQQYCDIDLDNNTCESASHQRPEEAIPTKDSRSDLLCHLERPIQLSDMHIQQEEAFQKHCDVDMDNSNESTSHQRPEEAIPTQDSRSDQKTILDNINEPSTSTHSYVICSPEGSSQERCDADWKTAVDKISAPSGSTHSCDVHSVERSSQDMLLPYMDTSNQVQNTSRSNGRKPFQCSSCSKKYSCNRAFHEHLRTHSDIYKKAQSISRCEPKPQSQRTLTGEKPYQCSVCNKKFTQKGDMNRHMRLHTGERLFQCSVCAKSFVHKGHLQYHMRTHTGEKPYQCSVCAKSFACKGNLHYHMGLHTGERPYNCLICDKTFIRNSDLSDHMRTHTGEKPFECSVCSKNFTRNHDLIRHMRTHTGERPYKCSICDKTFIRNSRLSDHMRTHTGERPYQCPICSRRFTRTWHLKAHMRTHTEEWHTNV